jgi:hypothetical protein
MVSGSEEVWLSDPGSSSVDYRQGQAGAPFDKMYRVACEVSTPTDTSSRAWQALLVGSLTRVASPVKEAPGACGAGTQRGSSPHDSWRSLTVTPVLPQRDRRSLVQRGILLPQLMPFDTGRTAFGRTTLLLPARPPADHDWAGSASVQRSWMGSCAWRRARCVLAAATSQFLVFASGSGVGAASCKNPT